VTLNEQHDDVSCHADNHSTYTDQTIDDDYHYDDYDYDNDQEAAGRRTDLVFHGLTEELHGMTDRQLVEWVLNDGLELDPSQYIEEVERFGLYRENQVRPISVKIQTVDKRNQILRLAKTLRPQRNFRKVYIQPWLSRRQQLIGKELREELRALRHDGYRNVTISRGKIVQRTNGQPDVVLYTPIFKYAHYIS